MTARQQFEGTRLNAAPNAKDGSVDLFDRARESSKQALHGGHNDRHPECRGLLQRKCACGGAPGPTGECEECRKKRETGILQRSTNRLVSPGPAEAPPIVHEVLRSPGQPLDAETRAFMEPRFHHDFSRVRIHHDGRATESARSVSAQAFTVGRNVVFGEGRYSPQTPAGQRLLAHELTHVVQQSDAASSLSAGLPLTISNENGPESEATAAESFASSVKPQTHQPTLQRKPEDATKLCGGPWSCAASPCEKPDPGREGNGKVATDWTLKLMIDAEAASAADVSGISLNIGHTYVEFSDSTGAAYTYGFYPNKASRTPDPLFRPEVYGCMVHPDTNHASCVDYTETLKLPRAKYQETLSFAQLLCKAPPPYNLLTYNCTTFARDVAKRAGGSLPAIWGKVGSGNLSVTADNPYTLIEGLRRRDVGPTYALDSDGDLREAIKKAKPAELSAAPVAEKIRVINRLLEGYFSDDDLEAIETLCGTVTTSAEMQTINEAVRRQEGELNERQGKRFHAAVSRGLGGTP